MKIETILSEAEKRKLEKLAEDKVALEAMKKVLLFGLYHNGVLNPGEESDPTVNFALSLAFKKENVSDEQIGRDLRVCAEAIRLVESAFMQVEKIKTIKEELKPEAKNPAR